MKRWQIIGTFAPDPSQQYFEHLLELLLTNRGITSAAEKKLFLDPPNPVTFTTSDVGIDEKALQQALVRIERAIADKESIVVYADYDADGITAGTIMWETLNILGARVMPYIPHRVEEGYGFSQKGLDTIKRDYNPALVISVDHGITAWEKVEYAQKLGMDVIVSDHHVKPDKLPDCLIVHTTKLCGAGVSWFIAKELLLQHKHKSQKFFDELLALAAIGTIADLVPLTGANRAIVKHGLTAINQTERVGLKAIIQEAQLPLGSIETYQISHILAPRLNAMGRLVYALDALRLLCTKQPLKAQELARQLGETNRDRQTLTEQQTLQAKGMLAEVPKDAEGKKLLFITHTEYNQGVIGLVAGKLVEQFYLPAIVVAEGKTVSKASARSIAGFNIIEAIRACSDLVLEAGGHPMAAGFSIETSKLPLLKARLEALAASQLTPELLTKTLKIDSELDLFLVNESLWKAIQTLKPFGMGNPEPLFATHHAHITDARLIGRDHKHLKLWLTHPVAGTVEAIAFGMGELFGKLDAALALSVAYSVDMNEWNGNRTLQLKVRDIVLAPNN